MTQATQATQATQTAQIVQVPDIAIKWAIKYSSCDTNYNLAAISNVNRHWRSLLCQEIGTFLIMTKAMAEADVKADVDADIEADANAKKDVKKEEAKIGFDFDFDYDHESGNNPKTGTGTGTTISLMPKSISMSVSRSMSMSMPEVLSEYKYLSNLLLPSMAVEVLRRQYDIGTGNGVSSSLSSSSSSFCLSWFPPEGIKVQKVNLNESSSSSSLSRHDYNYKYNYNYNHNHNHHYNGNDIDKYGDEYRYGYGYGCVCNSIGSSSNSSNSSSNSSNSSNNEDENCEIHFYRQRFHHQQQQQQQQQKAKAAQAAKAQARIGANSNINANTNTREVTESTRDDANNHNLNYNDYENDDDDDDTKNKDIVLCSNEWRGYRGAMDVLLPLGYTTAFVQSILHLAVNISSSVGANNDNDNDNDIPSNSSNVNNNVNNNVNSKINLNVNIHKLVQSDNERETTFAVRGAVFARPQHFCLCWDSDHAESKLVNHMSILGIDNDPNNHQNHQNRHGNEDGDDGNTITNNSNNNQSDNNSNNNNRDNRNRDRNTHENIFRDGERNCRGGSGSRSDHDHNNRTSHTNRNNHTNHSQNNYTHTRNSYKLMDLRRRKRRHDKMRRVKMKEALPRFIQSTPRKNPLLQDPVYSYSSSSSHGLGDGTGLGTGLGTGRRQKCLQFLNADKTRAVYLRTPPFDCGSVRGPITMFCVGIATEDGCFVSGLNTRFELGHLHGIDEMDKSIDMSPICICAESTVPLSSSCENDSDNNGDGVGTGIGSGSGSQNGGTVNVRSYSEDSSDSSCGGDYQIKRKGSIFCQCQIQYSNTAAGGSLSDEMSQRREPEQKNIYRGRMGPGRWHCYTAIFNGKDSVIRVDGCTEQVRNSTNSRNSAAAASSNNDNTPFLDGLTIGSDHSYEMTLCFGEGSEGEGEGSIAELAVFKGALQIQDIECYEKYLMKKHGIIHGQYQIFPQKENVLAGNIGNQWQEDMWRRQAHALITHPPNSSDNSIVGGDTGGGVPMSIPLRVAAQHRSVAWHRFNDVTGKNVKVSRIGSRQSHGSSDW